MVKQITRGKDIARNTYWSAVGMAAATMLAVQPVFADTIWDRFSTILKDVYGQVVAISTIVAVTVAAIALLIRMISRNQRAVEEAEAHRRDLDHPELSGLRCSLPAAPDSGRQLLRLSEA